MISLIKNNFMKPYVVSISLFILPFLILVPFLLLWQFLTTWSIHCTPRFSLSRSYLLEASALWNARFFSSQQKQSAQYLNDVTITYATDAYDDFLVLRNV